MIEISTSMPQDVRPSGKPESILGMKFPAERLYYKLELLRSKMFSLVQKAGATPPIVTRDETNTKYDFLIRGKDLIRLDVSEGTRVDASESGRIGRVNAYAGGEIKATSATRGDSTGAQSKLFVDQVEVLSVRGAQNRAIHKKIRAEAIAQEATVVRLLGNTLTTVIAFKKLTPDEDIFVIVEGTGNELKGQVKQKNIAPGVYTVEGSKLKEVDKVLVRALKDKYIDRDSSGIPFVDGEPSTAPIIRSIYDSTYISSSNGGARREKKAEKIQPKPAVRRRGLPSLGELHKDHKDKLEKMNDWLTNPQGTGMF